MFNRVLVLSASAGAGRPTATRKERFSMLMSVAPISSSPVQLAAETTIWRGRADSALGSVTVRIPWANVAETDVPSTRSGSKIVRVHRPKTRSCRR